MVHGLWLRCDWTNRHGWTWSQEILTCPGLTLWLRVCAKIWDLFRCERVWSVYDWKMLPECTESPRTSRSQDRREMVGVGDAAWGRMVNRVWEIRCLGSELTEGVDSTDRRFCTYWGSQQIVDQSQHEWELRVGSGLGVDDSVSPMSWKLGCGGWVAIERVACVRAQWWRVLRCADRLVLFCSRCMKLRG